MFRRHGLPLLCAATTQPSPPNMPFGTTADIWRLSTRTPTTTPKKQSLGKYSGAQLAVIALFKDFIREANKRTDERSRRALLSHIRGEFKKGMCIPRREFVRIEWHMHMGRKKLEELKKSKPGDKFGMVVVCGG
eukprot:PhM_4_TR11897/c0_g1_i1/m.42709/K18167/SDHAF1; succinate dehydrogenase assembly factor 1